MGDIVKLLCYLFVFILIFTINVEAPIGPPPITFPAVSVPEDLIAVLDSNLSADVSKVSQSGNQTVRMLEVVDGLNYSVASFIVNFEGDSPNFSGVTVDIDLDNYKALAHVVRNINFNNTKRLYVPKASDHNKVALCIGADDISEVSWGCASVDGVTEKVSGTSDFDYSLTTTTINGQEYWVIEGVKGSGGVSFKINVGGGAGPSVEEEGSTINLEEKENYEYVSKKNLEHFVFVGDTSYSFFVSYVDVEEEYVVLYFKDLNMSLAMSEGETENIDFDGDGVLDVVVTLNEIDYPIVILGLDKYVESVGLEFPQGEEVVYKEKTSFKEGGGIWSTFLNLHKEAKMQILYWIIFTILVLFLVFLIGGRVVGKVYKGI